jgi:hypothetical protein
MKLRPSLRAIAAGLALVLTTLAGAHAANADRFAQLHRIGIISALGDRVEVSLFGFTRIDGKDGYLPIDTWRLDDLAIREAATMLGGRFQISPVTYDKKPFLAADTDPPTYVNPPLKPLIQGLPTSDMDAYLVIRTATWSPMGTWSLEGLGAQKSKISFGQHPLVYVMLEVDLVQAGTGKTLISRTLGAPAMTHEDRGDWADTPEAMTPAQVEKLHQRIVELIPNDLARTLTSMGLKSP